MKRVRPRLASIECCVPAVDAQAARMNVEGDRLVARNGVMLGTSRAITLKVRQGQVTDQVMEDDTRGRRLRHSFYAISRGKPFGVGVDARRGRGLENAADGRNSS